MERRKPWTLLWLSLAAPAAIALGGAPEPPDVAARAALLKAVGREGAGNEEAAAAVRELVRLGPEALVPLLREFDGAGPVALNWLRAAAEGIAAGARRDRKLPLADLEAFVLDRDRAGAARRLAYEWLAGVDPAAPERLLPRFLDDPAVELRRDAVEREQRAAEALLAAGDRKAALAAFGSLLEAARDVDQVEAIAKRVLELGGALDLTRHFGCIQEWRLIGPFDNTNKVGYAAVYPPERGIDLEAECPGKVAPVRWIEHRSADRYGAVDLNKVLGKHMGVTAYALARIDSPGERPIHIRAGTPNALKVWLNGELLFTREEYHHGAAMDQYRAVGKLRPGRNDILIKVCQNEEKEEWTQDWKFQVRVCDPTGRGLL